MENEPLGVQLQATKYYFKITGNLVQAGVHDVQFSKPVELQRPKTSIKIYISCECDYSGEEILAALECVKREIVSNDLPDRKRAFDVPEAMSMLLYEACCKLAGANDLLTQLMHALGCPKEDFLNEPPLQ